MDFQGTVMDFCCLNCFQSRFARYSYGFSGYPYGFLQSKWVPCAFRVDLQGTPMDFRGTPMDFCSLKYFQRRFSGYPYGFSGYPYGFSGYRYGFLLSKLLSESICKVPLWILWISAV